MAGQRTDVFRPHALPQHTTRREIPPSQNPLPRQSA
jgi:hypothetical protein